MSNPCAHISLRALCYGIHTFHRGSCWATNGRYQCCVASILWIMKKRQSLPVRCCSHFRFFANCFASIFSRQEVVDDDDSIIAQVTSKNITHDTTNNPSFSWHKTSLCDDIMMPKRHIEKMEWCQVWSQGLHHWMIIKKERSYNFIIVEVCFAKQKNTNTWTQPWKSRSSKSSFMTTTTGLW